MNKQAVTIIVIIVLVILAVFAWKAYAPTGNDLSESLSTGATVSDIAVDLEATELNDLDSDFKALDAEIDAL